MMFCYDFIVVQLASYMAGLGGHLCLLLVCSSQTLSTQGLKRRGRDYRMHKKFVDYIATELRKIRRKSFVVNPLIFYTRG